MPVLTRRSALLSTLSLLVWGGSVAAREWAFFATTAIVYLFGNIDGSPYTQGHLREALPQYWAWLGEEFDGFHGCDWCNHLEQRPRFSHFWCSCPRTHGALKPLIAITPKHDPPRRRMDAGPPGCRKKSVPSLQARAQVWWSISCRRQTPRTHSEFSV